MLANPFKTQRQFNLKSQKPFKHVGLIWVVVTVQLLMLARPAMVAVLPTQSAEEQHLATEHVSAMLGILEME